MPRGLATSTWGCSTCPGLRPGLTSRARFFTQDVKVIWCTVHDNANSGVYFGGLNRGDLSNVYVSHCESFNHPGERGYGFYLLTVANALVERSVAHDNGANSRLPQAFAMEVSCLKRRYPFAHAQAVSTSISEALSIIAATYHSR